jgi:CRISPR type III-A-associated RAMP protein Csm5
MATLQIETLTPVHIGSGVQLKADSEYVYFSDLKKIAIVKPEKIFEIVGEQGLDAWTTAITNGTKIREYLRQRKPNLKPEDLATQVLKLNGTLSQSGRPPELRQQMHTATGRPLLPGSSLKGAIRTALLTQCIIEDPAFASNLSNLTKGKNTQPSRESDFDDSRLYKHYLGENPNQDVFRLLQIGDAYFQRTEALSYEVQNLKGQDWESKFGWLLLEAIPAGEKTTVRFQIQEFVKGYAERQHKDLNFPLRALEKLSNLLHLFKAIKAHNLHLLDEEIGFLEEKEIDYEYSNILNEILTTCKNLKDNECILRVGYGSGWDFMTGSWIRHDKVNEKEDLWLDSFKPVMRHPKYEGMPFPKTRRFDYEHRPLGFVKLRILD